MPMLTYHYMMNSNLRKVAVHSVLLAAGLGEQVPHGGLSRQVLQKACVAVGRGGQKRRGSRALHVLGDLQSTQIGKATDPVSWVPLNHTISLLFTRF